MRGATPRPSARIADGRGTRAAEEPRPETARTARAPRTVARGLAADAWMETGVNATAAMVSMKRVGSLGRRRSSVLVTKNPDARWLRADLEIFDDLAARDWSVFVSHYEGKKLC